MSHSRSGAGRLSTPHAVWIPFFRLLAGLLALLVGGAGVEAATYAVEQCRLGPESTPIRVYNRQTHSTIWIRRTRYPRVIRWSPDHTALAVLDERVGEGNRDWYRLLVWRNGERVRSIRSLRPFQRFESVRDLIWSPGRRHLLLLGPYGQGEADQGFNRLWCLHLRGERCQLLSNEAVTRAQWIGTTRVRYWTGKVVADRANPDKGTMLETHHDRECR
jgi:hypothetical protein